MPYAPAQDSTFLTRRGFVFLLIVVLGPIETRMIEEAPKTDEPPPPPPPKIETPPPFVPPPEVSIEIPTDATTSTAIQTVTNVRPTAPPPPVPQANIPRTAPKSDTRRPLSQPEYPPSSYSVGNAAQPSCRWDRTKAAQVSR